MNVARPTIELRPGFWLYMAALVAVGWMMSATLGVPGPAGILYGLLFATASATFLFLHETGHAIGGALVGMTWTRITFAIGRAGVQLDTDGAVTNRQRFWSTLAGPTLQAVATAACVGFAAATGQPLSPVGFAAALGLLEAAVNLLLPVPGLDCHQIVAAGRQVLAGRGNQPQTVPTPVPAMPQAA